MRFAFSYFVSAIVHVLALGIAIAWSANAYIQFRVAAGEPILVQFSPASAAEAPQPVTVQVTTEIEIAPEVPHEEFKPQEHAIAPQSVLVERRPTAEVGEEIARAAPEQVTQPKTEAQPRLAAQPPKPLEPEKPTEKKVERQQQVAEVETDKSAMPLLAQMAAQAGAKVDQLPNKLPANPEPPYPLDAWQAGREGRVTLRVSIAATGLVEKAEVAQTSGWASFDDAALTTISRWRFEPARRGGLPVSFEVLIPVRFQLRRG
jgi:periplasmic protein TonB